MAGGFWVFREKAGERASGESSLDRIVLGTSLDVGHRPARRKRRAPGGTSMQNALAEIWEELPFLPSQTSGSHQGSKL